MPAAYFIKWQAPYRSSLLHDVYFLYHMRLKKDDSRILCFISKSCRARGRLWIRRRRRKLAARQRANNHRFSFSRAQQIELAPKGRAGEMATRNSFRACRRARKLSGSVALHQKSARKLSTFLVRAGFKAPTLRWEKMKRRKSEMLNFNDGLALWCHSALTFRMRFLSWVYDLLVFTVLER